MTRAVSLDVSDLVGAPYGVREWGPAFDCFTLVAEVYRRLGWDYILPLDLDAQVQEKREILVAMVDRDRWTTVPRCALVGDIALIRGANEANLGIARHCAVLVAPGMMLHATEKLGVAMVPWRKVRPFTVKSVRAVEP